MICKSRLFVNFVTFKAQDVSNIFYHIIALTILRVIVYDLFCMHRTAFFGDFIYNLALVLIKILYLEWGDCSMLAQCSLVRVMQVFELLVRQRTSFHYIPY